MSSPVHKFMDTVSPMTVRNPRLATHSSARETLLVSSRDPQAFEAPSEWRVQSFEAAVSAGTASDVTTEVEAVRAPVARRLLVIDDEFMVLEVVQSCLEDLAGWQVLTASSAQGGLLQATTERPDAIILDMMMPGMDGLTFLQRLRANPKTQDIPVVLLTAKLEFTDPHRIHALGVTGAIAKPFDPFDLVAKLTEVLGWE